MGKYNRNYFVLALTATIIVYWQETDSLFETELHISIPIETGGFPLFLSVKKKNTSFSVM